MEIIIQPTAAVASGIAARLVARLLREKPSAVLGLATGNTPRMLYQELARRKLEWSKVTTFDLDEYVGLPPEHPGSYYQFMRENLFRHVNVTPANIHVPDGMTKDIPGFCAHYEQAIRAAGGIDLQVLGIGSDGHIGFNEPTSSLSSRTRIKTLTAQTRRDNSKFFECEADVPHHVITMGIGTILEARQIVLLAFGEQKAQAIAQAVEGPISAMCPASVLQLHPDTKVFLDEAASRLLTKVDYYRWVYDNKPDWQKTSGP
ncbi:MAG TPA: glucosamine-6-phosphate deaminase [Verrucomicrobiae bacterium]|nr:glucosamine-6-phosphate deaminase [Verrucomicrobiae bacterium]